MKVKFTVSRIGSHWRAQNVGEIWDLSPEEARAAVSAGQAEYVGDEPKPKRKYRKRSKT